MGGTDPVAHGMRGIANVQTTVTDVEIDQLSSEVVALRCGNALLFLVVCSRIPGGLPAEVVQGGDGERKQKTRGPCATHRALHRMHERLRKQMTSFTAVRQ